jgi:glycosyltransferase involved in cell wall biosynthesis
MINQLLSDGHNVTVLGPDSPTDIYAWEHIQLGQSSIKGRKALSLSKNMKSYLNQVDLVGCVLLIDWALVKPLSSLGKKEGVHWVCIDRSPPADANIFAKMQQRVWKKSWKTVASSLNQEGGCIGGVVVSNSHRQLIQNRFSIAHEKLCVIHAGVDNQLFQPTKRTALGLPVKMVYHGKMDRHRGILKLILLLDALESEGIEAELNLIGSGDLDEHLRNLARSKSNIIFHGSVNHSEICTILREFEIGLLPMPNLPIWTISSPLKRSEYLSSGLLVLGIDHLGHHLPTMEDDTEWFRLFEQQSFVDDAVLQIQKWLKDHRFSELSSAARQYAESYLDWNVTVQPLLELLNNLEE